MNTFAALNARVATINTLAALAESTFGNCALIGQARLSDTHERVTVTVQMLDAHLLAWCAERGITPSESVSETDYTMYEGGGYVTRRYRDAVVAEVEGGRLTLVSCEVLSTRPATSTEQDAGVAVA